MLLPPGPVDEIAREARMPSKANIPINGEGAQSPQTLGSSTVITP